MQSRKEWRDQEAASREEDKPGDDEGDDPEMERTEAPRVYTFGNKVDRGLFRIWLVLTIIWSVFIFAVVVGDRMALGVAFVPPVGALIIGLMFRWAIQGFFE
jgi:hypothetical protein